MRYVITILVLLFSLSASTQIYQPYSQYGGKWKRIIVDSVFNIPRFTDTTQANLHIGFDSCGAMFFSYTKDSIYYRACNPKRWISLGSGGGTGSVDSVVLRNDTLKYYIAGTGTVITPVVRYNFTSLADGDLIKWDAANTEFVNFISDSLLHISFQTSQYDSVPQGGEFYVVFPDLEYNDVQVFREGLLQYESTFDGITISNDTLFFYPNLSDSERVNIRIIKDLPNTRSLTFRAFPYLLDDYPTSLMAFSLRKLTGAYAGNIVRVRRSSDDAEQNFGLSGSYLDTIALKTFVGANDGFVVTWYDQSGNANNATQSTNANQPLIIDNGVLERVNGKVTVNFGDESTAYYLVLPTGLLNGATNLSYFHVAQIFDIVASNDGVFGPSNTNSVGLEILQQAGLAVRGQVRINNVQRVGVGSFIWDSDVQGLTEIFGNPTNVEIYNNGSSVTLTSSVALPALNFNGVYAIGLYNSTSENMSGNIQELIIYNTNKLSSRTGIETNINSFYIIY